MASDNTVSDMVPLTDIPKSDNTISELLPRPSICEPEKTCHFDRIPQEIRDQIYDLIFQEKEMTMRGVHYTIRTTSPIMRLLNRRIKTEYDARPAINNFVEASDCDLAEADCLCNCDYDEVRRLPTLAPRTTILHMNLIVCQDSPAERRKCTKIAPADAELEDHFGGSIHSIGRLSLLREVSITLSCGNLTCATAVLSSHEIWTKIPKLSRVTLLRPLHEPEFDPRLDVERYTCQFKGEVWPHSAVFFRRRETMATWTAGHGWQIDEKVAEECRKEEAWFLGRIAGW
jgi:hypothetical protein